jgi:hypothetical protein
MTYPRAPLGGVATGAPTPAAGVSDSDTTVS